MSVLNGQVFLDEVKFKDNSREAKFILFRREKDFYNYINSFIKENPLYDNLIYYRNPEMNRDGSITTEKGNLFPNEVI